VAAGHAEQRTEKSKNDVTDKMGAGTEWKNKNQTVISSVDLEYDMDGTYCIHTHACVYKIHTQNCMLHRLIYVPHANQTILWHMLCGAYYNMRHINTHLCGVC
jgi:hypothetical protein